MSEHKTAMFLYRGFSMNLSRNLFTRLNRIRLLLSKSTLVIRARVVLPGYNEKADRDKKIHLFTCKNFGYKPNDDRIGAMNLYGMGISYLED